MSSLILRTVTRLLLPVILLYSVFLLLRGHDEPGGGFVGGLVAAAGFALVSLAYNTALARQTLRFDPRTLVAVGLLLTLAAGGWGMLVAQQPFLTGQWVSLELGFLGEVKLGTPLLFDMGVYLVVVGMMLLVIFTLGEEPP